MNTEIQQPLTRSFEWWRDCNETDPKTMLTQVIQQPLKNPSGKCNLLDIGWTDDPAVGKDYPLKPMHLLNKPRIELPEPPVGQKWEYRGKGWVGEGNLLTCGEDNRSAVHTRFASGYPSLHYWQAVDVVPQKEEPQYRMLEEGEVIREGDEYFYHDKGVWEGTAGYAGHGRKYSKAFWGSDVRRPLSQLTDSQKLTLAITALEKARGWTVADEVLEKIL